MNREKTAGERVKADIEEVAWSGRFAAGQLRIRLMRSFDERHHSYQAYMLADCFMQAGNTGKFRCRLGAQCGCTNQPARRLGRFRAARE